MKLLNKGIVEIETMPFKTDGSIVIRMTIDRFNCNVSQFANKNRTVSKNKYILYDKDTEKAYLVKGSYDEAIKLLFHRENGGLDKIVNVIGFGKN